MYPVKLYLYVVRDYYPGYESEDLIGPLKLKGKTYAEPRWDYRLHIQGHTHAVFGFYCYEEEDITVGLIKAKLEVPLLQLTPKHSAQDLFDEVAAALKESGFTETS